MAIFRVQKNTNYTVMSNYHLREKNMSLKAKGLLSWMLSNTDDWDYSIAGIVASCKENETAIKTALDELQKFGYLTITKKYPNETESGRIEYEYTVYEQPVEKQDIENLCLENQGQISTIQTNTKKEIDNTKVLSEKSSKKPKTSSTLFSSNVVSTSQTTTTEKPKRKSNAYTKCLEMISMFSTDETTIQLLKQYLEIRLAIKDKPMYPNQWKGLLNKLDKLSDTEKGIQQIIQQSIELGWATFYPYNPNAGKGSSKQDWKTDVAHKNVHSVVMTSEEEQAFEQDLQRMRKEGIRVDF